MRNKENIIQELQGRYDIYISTPSVDYKPLLKYNSGAYREGYIAGLLFCLGADTPIMTASNKDEILLFINRVIGQNDNNGLQ